MLDTYFILQIVLEYNCGDKMSIFNDIVNFIGCLSLVDIIFFVAILILLILVVTLIYFIRINKEVLGSDDFFPPSNDIEKKEEKNNTIIEKIEVLQKENVIDEYNDEEGELLDLESLTKKLQAEENGERVTCTEYEKDQEEKAIISYEELLQKHNKYTINYEKEELMDDLIVKKVTINSEVRVISYGKEEAFLNALKELNSLLN